MCIIHVCVDLSTASFLMLCYNPNKPNDPICLCSDVDDKHVGAFCECILASNVERLSFGRNPLAMWYVHVPCLIENVFVLQLL